MCTLFTPELLLVSLALVLLLLDAFLPKLPKRVLCLIGALGIAGVFFWTIYPSAATQSGHVATDSFWYSFSLSSPYITSAKSLILIAAFLTFVMLNQTSALTARFVTGDSNNQDGTGELYILPLFTTASMMWMCSARDFISLFVALELTTLSFYVMVGFFRRNIGSLEGGIKYLVTGAMSAAVLIMGIAWYYGTTGSFDLNALANGNIELTAGTYLALGLIILGLIFKIGAVPMHVWVPDVYQGAPTPITAFLSVASKTAGLCVLFTFIASLPVSIKAGNFSYVLMLITIATLLIGNLGAIGQSNVKRMLGYSSIGHAGYILPFFIIQYPLPEAWLYYMFCYLPMTFGAFYILSLIRTQTGKEDLEAFKGLGKRNPRLAAVTTLMFASLAGVPLTGGFTAKFLSFKAIIGGNLWIVLGVAIVTAAAGFYYYFKPIRAMYWEKPEEGAPVIKVSPLSISVLTVLSLAVIYLGISAFGNL